MAARASWEALGSTVVVQVEDPARLADAQSAVRRELESIDRACSRFKADSELCAVNARTGQTRRISPLLAEAIGMSLEAAEMTGGAIDPTIGRCLQIAGYDRDWKAIEQCAAVHPGSAPAEASGTEAAAVAPALEVRDVAGWRGVQLDRRTPTVRVPTGVSLDLGAVAKAWAADRAAQAARRASGAGALVGVGGDLAIAGKRAQGWLVHVTDDHHSSPDAPGQTVRVTGGGIATSSTAVRRWRQAGCEMHHIIDPRTGRPARSRWRTVSVAAADCAQANIAATAALIMSGAGAEWLERRRLPARLVGHDGAVSYVAGWPELECA